MNEKTRDLLSMAAEGCLFGPQYVDLYVEQGLNFIPDRYCQKDIFRHPSLPNKPILKPIKKWVLEFLYENGYSLNDILIYRGNSINKGANYDIIELADLGIQIAVCNDLNKPILILNNVLKEYEWASYDKDYLKNRGAIEFYYGHNKSTNNLADALHLQDRSRLMSQEEVQRYRKAAWKRSKMLSDELVFFKSIEVMSNCPQGEEHWPVRNDNPIIGIPDETWNIWNISKYKGARGLAKGAGVSTLIRDQVAFRAEIYRNEKGVLPNVDDSVKFSNDFPYVNWGMIGRAFLNNFGYPYSLGQLYMDYSFIKRPKRSVSSRLSVNL